MKTPWKTIIMAASCMMFLVAIGCEQKEMIYRNGDDHVSRTIQKRDRRIDELESENKRLNSQLKESRNQEKKLTSELKQQRETQKKSERKITQLEERLRDEKNYKKQCEELTREVERLRKELKHEEKKTPPRSRRD